MPKQLSYIEPISEGGHTLTMKDGWELVAVIGAAQIGRDVHWQLVVARDVEEEQADA